MRVKRGPSHRDEHDRLIAAIRRHLAPVALRAGWVTEPDGLTFCGSPEDLAAAQPWLVENGVLSDEDLGPHGYCTDMHVYRQDGWVELSVEHFVRWSLWAPADTADQLDGAVASLADQLADGLAREVILDGAPRPPDDDAADGRWQHFGGRNG